MKTWQKPMLIVLVTGTPEESVLSACKWFDEGASPNEYDSQCWVYWTSQMCMDCDEPATS